MADKMNNKMKNYIAIVTEKTSPKFGQIFANTKISSKYKGMDFITFSESIKYIQCYNYEIKEVL